MVGGGVSLLAGPLAAAGGASVAVTAATSFLFFSSAAISWPLLIGSTIICGALMAGGNKCVEHGLERRRQALKQKLWKALDRRALGPGESLFDALAQQIDALAKLRMEAAR